MKNDILSEYYQPLLEQNNFIPIPCPEKFSSAGQCWKIEPEVGGGYYWVYGKQDLYDIKIHDFFFHQDFGLDVEIPECISILRYDSISGEELSPYRRLSAGDIQTIVGGNYRYRALIHKRIPVHSVGIEILPAYYEDFLKKQYERRVLNQKETTLAQQKQQAIKDAFREWIWKNPQRRQTLVQLYNERYNSDRPREYDGSHINFWGMSPEITLREHQRNAIAHILYGGNTLLAHEVGSGKTFEMVAAAMESRRLGLCSKSMIVVPNHLIEQWASEFLRLYPSANLLVARKKDFEPANRKTFCSKIATGEYDAVIIGHSQFEKIPMSLERQRAVIEQQITEIEEGIEELKASGAERFTVKSMERTRKSLSTRLEKLMSGGRKDDVVCFEQLGVDRLFVDEAHGYKNLFMYTKMQNVAGISTTDAQKSSDMYMKCQYLDEKTGGRGVIFATGTPISNSMTELYTMMRYLQSDTLREKGWSHFDCWAAHFGETKTVIELAPEGTGYRARTRFAKFYNLPELINIWKEAADVKTADQLNLPRPEAIYHNEVTVHYNLVSTFYSVQQTRSY